MTSHAATYHGYRFPTGDHQSRRLALPLRCGELRLPRKISEGGCSVLNIAACGFHETLTIMS